MLLKRKVILLLCIVFSLNLLGISAIAADAAVDSKKNESIASARKKELAKKKQEEAKARKAEITARKEAAANAKKEEAKARKEAAKIKKEEAKLRKEAAEQEKSALEQEQAVAVKEKKQKEKKIKVVKTKQEKSPSVKFEETYVYKDAGFKGNMYIPTGWMGDYGDLRLSSRSFVKPKEGMTCMKVSYSAKQSQGAGWAGIYWQNPANNWGVEKKGLNLTGAKKLVFYIKGEKGGEIIDGIKVGGITGTYPDTTDVPFGPIILTKSWKKYSIDLKDADLTHIIGAFAFVVTAETNPDGIIFYLDEISFV